MTEELTDWQKQKAEHERKSNERFRKVQSGMRQTVADYINRKIDDDELWEKLVDTKITKTHLTVFLFHDVKGRRPPK